MHFLSDLVKFIKVPFLVASLLMASKSEDIQRCSIGHLSADYMLQYFEVDFHDKNVFFLFKHQSH